MTIECGNFKIKTDKSDADNIIKLYNILTPKEKLCIAVVVTVASAYVMKRGYDILSKLVDNKKSENIIEIEKENDYEIR